MVNFSFFLIHFLLFNSRIETIIKYIIASFRLVQNDIKRMENFNLEINYPDERIGCEISRFLQFGILNFFSIVIII